MDNAYNSTVTVRALNGPKTTGPFIRAHLAQCMQELGYKSCDADFDLLMKSELRPED